MMIILPGSCDESFEYTLDFKILNRLLLIIVYAPGFGEKALIWLWIDSAFLNQSIK